MVRELLFGKGFDAVTNRRWLAVSTASGRQTAKRGMPVYFRITRTDRFGAV